MALTDEEKRSKYIDSLFYNVISGFDLSDELANTHYSIADKLVDTYRSVKFDDADAGKEAAQDFVNWLNGWDHNMSSKDAKSGNKALSGLKADIESQLKEYIKDCTSKDLVIDQLYEAAKYVARELNDLFEGYCYMRFGDRDEYVEHDVPEVHHTIVHWATFEEAVQHFVEFSKKYSLDASLETVREFVKDNVTLSTHWVERPRLREQDGDYNADVFHKNIYGPKPSDRRSGKL
mgnify:CR=1 FL=1